MAKLQPAERLELKGVMCRIIHIVLEIDTRMQPSLHDRVEELRKREHTEQELQDLYDQYIEDVAEEYVKRIEN